MSGKTCQGCVDIEMQSCVEALGATPAHANASTSISPESNQPIVLRDSVNDIEAINKLKEEADSLVETDVDQATYLYHCAAIKYEKNEYYENAGICYEKAADISHDIFTVYEKALICFNKVSNMQAAHRNFVKLLVSYTHHRMTNAAQQVDNDYGHLFYKK